MEAQEPMASVWRTGDVVGHYRLEELVGRGGMGEVWAAADLHLGRRVALKRLIVTVDDPSLRERFLREARVQARLDSPHLVTIYAVETVATSADRKELLLVMELVEGETLDRLLQKGNFAREAAVSVMRQLAETLAVAHRNGVVHRDVKPSNLMLRRDGTLMVLDFGLALLRPEATWATDSDGLTRSGFVVGTIAYMSPEQARAETVGPAADVWACGVLLYELLSGARPFGGASPMEQMVAVLRDEPRPLQELVPDVAPDLLELVAICLEKDPAKRPKDGDELLSRLPLDRVPVLARESRLYAPEVLARSRSHDVLTPRAAALALGAGFLGILLTILGAAGMWPARSEPLPRLADFERRARSLVEELDLERGLENVESGFLALPNGPSAWVRLSPTSLLDPRHPPTADFPYPAEGEVRMVFDSRARLLVYERWPDARPARPDALDVLLRAAGHPGAGAAGSEAVRTADGTELQVERRGKEIRRLSRSDVPVPGASRMLLSGLDSTALGLLVAAAVTGSLLRLRAPLSDRSGALALALASVLIQVSKLVLNPRTISGGIWWGVLVESLGVGVIAGLMYLAFEPTVRRRWPGMLTGWMRLASARHLDAHVGRELLLGVAALLPFGLLVLVTGAVARSLGLAWPFLVLFGLDRPGIYGFMLLDVTQSAVLAGGAFLLAGGVLSRVVPRSGLALSLPALLAAVYLLKPLAADPASIALVAGAAAILTALGLRGGFVAIVTFTAAAMVVLLVPPLWGVSWTWPYAASGPVLVSALALLGFSLSRRRPPPAPDDRDAPTELLSPRGSETGSTVFRTRRPSRFT